MVCWQEDGIKNTKRKKVHIVLVLCVVEVNKRPNTVWELAWYKYWHMFAWVRVKYKDITHIVTECAFAEVFSNPQSAHKSTCVMGKCPEAYLQTFKPCSGCGASSGELGAGPASDLLLSHELGIVSPSHFRGDYIQLLCKFSASPDMQLFQLSAGICLAAAVHNKVFQNTDAAFVRNVGQHQNSLQVCRLKIRRRHNACFAFLVSF